MPTRSFVSFRPAPRRIGEPPSPDALFSAFLSSLSVEEGTACAVLYSAAIRHFLCWLGLRGIALGRSEEHTSELQSLMRISYAVFCLKKKKITHSLEHNYT